MKCLSVLFNFVIQNRYITHTLKNMASWHCVKVKRKARLKARVQCVYLPLIKAVQFEALLSERPSLSSRNNQRDCSIPVQFPADMGSVLNCIPMLVGYGLNSGLTCVCVCGSWILQVYRFLYLSWSVCVWGVQIK